MSKKMKFTTLLRTLSVLTLLPSCVGGLDVETSPVHLCKNNNNLSISQENSETFKTINMEIEDGKFHPSLLQLSRQQPYLFLIENKDNELRWFTAINFFRSASIKKITVNEKDVTNDCPASIMVRNKGVTKIHLTPIKAGIYEFESDHLLNSGLKLIWGGETNVVFVNR